MGLAARGCPCGADATYAECCAPLHRGVRAAGDAAALMRSRYAAFATKDVDYLWRTLHSQHVDRGRGEAEVKGQLRDACRENRYLGLRVIEAREVASDGIARVLFAARVFRRGRELSFVELSEFAREDGGWKYLRGDGRTTPFDEAVGLTIDGF